MKSKSTEKKNKGEVTYRKIKDDSQDFPGYKPYPPQEDIMNRRSDSQRIEGDLENSSPSGRGLRTPQEEKTLRERRFSHDEMVEGAESEMRDEVDEEEKEDSDLTKEDFEALGPKDLSMDMGDDEQLKQRSWPVDFSAEDLDVPGSEIDDVSEEIGSEDEENNSYSLGGDRHEE